MTDTQFYILISGIVGYLIGIPLGQLAFVLCLMAWDKVSDWRAERYWKRVDAARNRSTRT